MADDTDNMAPAASPGTLTQRTGVRRVNNWPMYILFAVLAAFLGVMMMVAADRSEQQKTKTEEAEKKGGSTVMYADQIAGLQTEAMIPPAGAPVVPSLPDTLPEAIPIARPMALDLPPTPPRQNLDLGQPPAHAVRDEEAERIRNDKLALLEQAIKAKTGVPIAMTRNGSSTRSAFMSTGTGGGSNDVAAQLARVRQQIDAEESGDYASTYQARLAQAQRMAGAAGGRAAPAAQAATGNGGYAQFGSDSADRWAHDGRVMPPRTRYALLAGYVMPATLISGINSELPGQIIAQIAQDVYDSATGQRIVIPQGSRLVGTYDSEVAYGQARALIAWQRIDFPDGKTLDIGAMPGTDGAGYAGFHDQVNNHYLRLFGSALLMSAITAGISYNQDKIDSNDRGNNNPSMSSALSQALGQQLGQVTAQLITKNMNISPTLTIRPGYRFNVMVTKDLAFASPYESFDYQRQGG